MLKNQEIKRVGTDSASIGLHKNTVTQGKDYRSMFNGDSIGNSEMTLETVRAMNEQLKFPMSKRLGEIR